jgi:ribosome-associated protein
LRRNGANEEGDRLDGRDEARERAEWVMQAAQGKQGEDVVVLDVRELTLVTDYFVLVTGRSVVHVDTLAEAITEQLASRGVPLLHREGRQRAHWVLLDYGDVVVHILTPEERQYYNLERLWGDAKIERYHEADR